MNKVSDRKKQIGIRVDTDLHKRLVDVARQHNGSLNKWAAAAFREKLAREARGKVSHEIEPHHEDARNDFERTWNRTLNRWLRKPGKWRCALDLLAEIWKLPDLPKQK